MSSIGRRLPRLGGVAFLVMVIPACTGEVAEEPLLTDPLDTAAPIREAAVESDRALAEQGDAGAQARLAEAYYLGDGARLDFREALRWARLAAEQGNAHGQGLLAAAYNTGSGVAHDGETALHWARLAAEQGDAGGQTVLAFLYENGRGGVAPDYAEAVRWARLAAEQESPDAQAILGMMYRSGRGVEQDAVSAYMWLTLSASHPRIEGVRNVLDNLVARMTPEQIAEAEARVRDWRNRRGAFRRGDPRR